LSHYPHCKCQWERTLPLVTKILCIPRLV
jgi:hypothetical protein